MPSSRYLLCDGVTIVGTIGKTLLLLSTPEDGTPWPAPLCIGFGGYNASGADDALETFNAIRGDVFDIYYTPVFATAGRVDVVVRGGKARGVFLVKCLRIDGVTFTGDRSDVDMKTLVVQHRSLPGCIKWRRSQCY